MLIYLQLEALWVLHFRQRLSYRTAWVLGLLGVLVELALVLCMGRLVGAGSGGRFSSNEYFGFAAVGVSVSSLVAGIAAASARWVREGQLTGTLEGVMLSPMPHGLLISLAGLVALPGLVARLLLELGCAALLGAQFTTDPLQVAGLVAASAVAILPVGLIASAAILLLKRGDVVGYALSAASILLSGTYFPRDVLPPALQQLAMLVPTTHVLDFARGTLLPGENGLDHLSGLGVYALCIWPLAVGSLAFAVKFAKLRGTLSHY